jgi:D-alanyl-lipoteichoic acid acyltransferase DltB (MBOAT superfamily)
MLFNSTVFLQFFAAFLLLYFLCRKSLTARNLLIVGGSWLFYGWWDWRFLGLLIFSGCFDFGVGLLLGRETHARKRKFVLQLSVATNLCLLGFFKYYDFFAGSMGDLLTRLNVPFHASTLGIILPVGISFYTFQSLAYVIDVYRGEMQPTRNLLHYLAYVSFFPQLIAGPIQRGHDLLPQLQRTLTITREMLRQGTWLILWGMFKKVVMADNLASMVEMVFENPAAPGPAVVAGTLAFAFQIYGDFSGYSDMARGFARILGFDLRQNFNLPYFAADLREFWQRWHITLSTWLRDYLYISLGGNRRGPWRTYANLLMTMLLGGLWHGAAWNFILWGGWHGAGLVCTHLWQKRQPVSRPIPVWLSLPATFLFVLYGWILFRAGSLDRICGMTSALALWTVPDWLPHYLVSLLILVAPLAAIELWQKRSNNQFVVLAAPPGLRSGIQGALLLAILLFWEKKSVPFIYFQF